MEPFTIDLGNGAACSGLTSIPKQSTIDIGKKPLIVGIHGGSCTAAYWDLLPSHSAKTVSDMTGVPFVSINRPGYPESIFTTDTNKEEDFWIRTGKWLHELAIPALWQKYGKPNGCSSIVITAHSMGCPSSIICAALHAQDKQAAYPLAGLIVSGWNSEHSTNRPGPSPGSTDTHAVFSRELKYTLMLTSSSCHSPEVEKAFDDQDKRQNALMPKLEWASAGHWHQVSGAEYTPKVVVPMMANGADEDWLWSIHPASMAKFKAMFPNVKRWDDCIMPGAPHAIEWGHGGFGYLVRCFGWAIEIVAS